MRNPFRRRVRPAAPVLQFVGGQRIDLADGFPPELLGMWDQQAAGVRDAANSVVDLAAESFDCPCGATPDGPEHTIRLQANLLRSYNRMEMAAIAAEFAIRAATAKVEG